MTRHLTALVTLVATVAALSGCGPDQKQLDPPADTPATGTTSSTMPGTPASAVAPAASN